MIINIRGTHGSGKSTIVRTLLEQFKATPEGTDEKGKILGYKFRLPLLYKKRDCFVVGSYKNACGGCDGIQPYSLIWPRVVEYAARGHVLFEGALVSSSYGNIGRDSAIYGDQFVFAFLDTPIEVCLERIQKRREARGNTNPVDPRNTVSKYESVQRSIPKIRDEFGRRMIILNHLDPIPQLLEILRSC